MGADREWMRTLNLVGGQKNLRYERYGRNTTVGGMLAKVRWDHPGGGPRTPGHSPSRPVLSAVDHMHILVHVFVLLRKTHAIKMHINDVQHSMETARKADQSLESFSGERKGLRRYWLML